MFPAYAHVYSSIHGLFLNVSRMAPEATHIWSVQSNAMQWDILIAKSMMFDVIYFEKEIDQYELQN